MNKKMGIVEVDVTHNEKYISEGYQKRFAGKKRSDLDSSVFLFPANRSFPITSRESIMRALHDFGRSNTQLDYPSFVKKLYNHVKSKHPEWLSAFPDETLKKAGIKSN